MTKLKYIYNVNIFKCISALPKQGHISTARTESFNFANMPKRNFVSGTHEFIYLSVSSCLTFW